MQDGICKTCRIDFQGERYYCSSCDKKFEEWRRNKIRQKYEILAICFCGVRLTKDSLFIHQVREYDVGPIKQLVTHHTSYSPEETMPVCSSCHSKIEHSKDPEFKQYKAKDKRPKYIRKTIDVWCDSCRGKTPVHRDVFEEGASYECTKCRKKREREEKPKKRAQRSYYVSRTKSYYERKALEAKFGREPSKV